MFYGMMLPAMPSMLFGEWIAETLPFPKEAVTQVMLLALPLGGIVGWLYWKRNHEHYYVDDERNTRQKCLDCGNTRNIVKKSGDVDA